MKTSLVLVALLQLAVGFRLNILHTNDMHARLEEISSHGGYCAKDAKCYGGFARLAAEAARIRALSPDDTLFLNAGDNYQGTPYYTVFKWRVIKEFVDRLGIDVMSLGNHEFDDGVEGLEPFLRAVKTPNIAANLDLSRTPGLTGDGVNLKPSVNLFVKGVNISVIGYVTPDTTFLARPGTVGFVEEIPVLQRLAKQAKAGGAKIVIALGHSGFSMDEKIAAQVQDVDVVIGGHTNTFLYTGTPPDLEVPESTYPHMVRQPKSGKMVPVVQAFYYTKYLGYLTLNFDSDFKLVNATGNPILLSSDLPQDPTIQADILQWKNNMSAQLDEVVGRIVVDLDGQCKGGECNMGNFFTDAVVDYHVRETEGQLYQTGWTNAPIAVINGGAIRTSLNLNETKGSISEGDLLTVVPFDNMMVRLSVTGEQLKEALEHSVKGYSLKRGRGLGGFLQVSGLKVVYDVTKPEGSRVVDVQVRCGACLVPEFRPFNLTDEYSVIVSEYMAQGGDGYDVFKNIPLEKQEKLEWREVDALRSYATKGTPLYPGVEGRLVVIKSKEPDSSATGGSVRSQVPLSLIAMITVCKALSWR